MAQWTPNGFQPIAGQGALNPFQQGTNLVTGGFYAPMTPEYIPGNIWSKWTATGFQNTQRIASIQLQGGQPFQAIGASLGPNTGGPDQPAPSSRSNYVPTGFDPGPAADLSVYNPATESSQMTQSGFYQQTFGGQDQLGRMNVSTPAQPDMGGSPMFGPFAPLPGNTRQVIGGSEAPTIAEPAPAMQAPSVQYQPQLNSETGQWSTPNYPTEPTFTPEQPSPDLQAPTTIGPVYDPSTQQTVEPGVAPVVPQGQPNESWPIVPALEPGFQPSDPGNPAGTWTSPSGVQYNADGTLAEGSPAPKMDTGKFGVWATNDQMDQALRDAQGQPQGVPSTAGRLPTVYPQQMTSMQQDLAQMMPYDQGGEGVAPQVAADQAGYGPSTGLMPGTITPISEQLFPYLNSPSAQGAPNLIAPLSMNDFLQLGMNPQTGSFMEPAGSANEHWPTVDGQPSANQDPVTAAKIQAVQEILMDPLHPFNTGALNEATLTGQDTNYNPAQHPDYSLANPFDPYRLENIPPSPSSDTVGLGHPELPPEYKPSGPALGAEDIKSLTDKTTPSIPPITEGLRNVQATDQLPENLDAVNAARVAAMDLAAAPSEANTPTAPLSGESPKDTGGTAAPGPNPRFAKGAPIGPDNSVAVPKSLVDRYIASNIPVIGQPDPNLPSDGAAWVKQQTPGSYVTSPDGKSFQVPQAGEHLVYQGKDYGVMPGGPRSMIGQGPTPVTPLSVTNYPTPDIPRPVVDIPNQPVDQSVLAKVSQDPPPTVQAQLDWSGENMPAGATPFSAEQVAAMQAANTPLSYAEPDANNPMNVSQNDPYAVDVGGNINGTGGRGAGRTAFGQPADPLPLMKGYSPNMSGVDPRLLDIAARAATHLPDGYQVEISSGKRGNDPYSQHYTGNAIDVHITDPQGNILTNRGDDPTGLYTQWAKAAYGEMQASYPQLANRLAWGGAFGTSAGSSVPDIMHLDLGGDRGNLRPANRLSNLMAKR
jgi:hypothetical protein